MPLLKSLFCLHGFDNRTRFFTIVITALITFLILSAAINVFAIQLILLILACATTSLSAYRRAKDANKNPKPYTIAGFIYFVSGGLLLLIESGYAIIPLFVTIACLLSLLTYPSQASKDYVLGYHGPMDLTSMKRESAAMNKSRIEPTFAGPSIANEHEARVAAQSTDDHQSFATHTPSESSVEDLGVRVRELASQYRNMLFVFAGILIIIAISFAVINTEETTNSEPPPIEVISETQNLIERIHPLEMPDDFTLFVSTNDGLIINWQADEQVNGIYWELLTAKGDQSCQHITFNNGDKIRPLNVTVENKTAYFAHFSPLDTQQLLKQIAFRGNFSLCGYKFSLKGSQSALGRHSYYADKVEY